MHKKFYKECPEVANMSPEKVAEIRSANNNTTVDRLFLEGKDNPNTGPIPNPIEKFEQCFADYPDLLGFIRHFFMIFQQDFMLKFNSNIF